MKRSRRPVEPSDHPPPEDPLRVLRHGFPDPDALVLATVFTHLYSLPSEAIGDQETALETFRFAASRAFGAFPHSREAAHLTAMREVTRAWVEEEWYPRGVSASRWSALGTKFRRGARLEVLRAILPVWTEALAPLDLSVGFVAAVEHAGQGEDLVFGWLAIRWLHGIRAVTGGWRNDRHVLDLARILGPNLEAIRLRGDEGPRSTGKTYHDARTLEFWLSCLGPRTLAAVVPLVERDADDTVGSLAWGVVFRVDSWVRSGSMHRRSKELDDWVRLDPYRAPVPARQFLGAVRARSSGRDDDLGLYGASWQVCWRLAERRPDCVPAELAAGAVESARRALGKLRPMLRRAQEPGTAGEFLRAWSPLMDAVRLVAQQDGLWPALRALLLAFRALSVPAVASDLRYWGEQGREAVPAPWANLPAFFVGIVHSFAARSQVNDPDLLQLRQDFVAFCLDKLKAKDGRPIEPSPDWRECYVRAVRELRANPRGTGHHVLHWSSANDEDAHVREVAAAAYDEMRRDVALPPGSSPRRAIFAAFWWLRQAHLLALGSEVDPHGAQRTRQKETRRTREEESSVET